MIVVLFLLFLLLLYSVAVDCKNTIADAVGGGTGGQAISDSTVRSSNGVAAAGGRVVTVTVMDEDFDTYVKETDQ